MNFSYWLNPKWRIGRLNKRPCATCHESAGTQQIASLAVTSSRRGTFRFQYLTQTLPVKATLLFIFASSQGFSYMVTEIVHLPQRHLELRSLEFPVAVFCCVLPYLPGEFSSLVLLVISQRISMCM